MSCVHYKFRSFMEYKKVIFEGLNISLADLKRAIADKEKIGLTNFDLQITNAQTKLQYVDDTQLVPRNSSVLVSRVPALEQKKLPKIQDNGKSGIIDQSRVAEVSTANEAAISALRQDLTNPDLTEQQRFMLTQKMSTATYDPANYAPRGKSVWVGRPPPTYTCNRCNQTGHWIKNCPSGLQRRPTGMPREELVGTTADNPRAYLHPSGVYVVPKMHQRAYEQGKKERPPFLGDEDQPVSTPPPVQATVVPEELQCQICKEPMRDAVLISCCGTSFCDECVREKLLETDSRRCPSCGESGMSPDSLVANKNTRKSVAKFVNETNYSYSQQSQSQTSSLSMSLRNLFGAPPSLPPAQPASFTGLKISLTGGGSKGGLPAPLAGLMAPLQQTNEESPETSQPLPPINRPVASVSDSPDVNRSPADREISEPVIRPPGVSASSASDGSVSSVIATPLHDLNLPPPNVLPRGVIPQMHRPPMAAVAPIQSSHPPGYGMHPIRAPPPGYQHVYQFAPPAVNIGPRFAQQFPPNLPPGVSSLPPGPRGPEGQPPPPGLGDTFQRMPVAPGTVPVPYPQNTHTNKYPSEYWIETNSFLARQTKDRNKGSRRRSPRRERERSSSSESSAYSARSHSRSPRDKHRSSRRHRRRRSRSRTYSPHHRPRRHRSRSIDSRTPPPVWVPPVGHSYKSYSPSRNRKYGFGRYPSNIDPAEAFIASNVAHQQTKYEGGHRHHHHQSHIPADPHVPEHSRYSSSMSSRPRRSGEPKRVLSMTEGGASTPTPPPTPTNLLPVQEATEFEKEKSAEPSKLKSPVEPLSKKPKKLVKDDSEPKKVVKKKPKSDIDTPDKGKKKKKKLIKIGVIGKPGKKKRSSTSVDDQANVGSEVVEVTKEDTSKELSVHCLGEENIATPLEDKLDLHEAREDDGIEIKRYIISEVLDVRGMDIYPDKSPIVQPHFESKLLNINLEDNPPKQEPVKSDLLGKKKKAERKGTSKTLNEEDIQLDKGDKKTTDTEKLTVRSSSPQSPLKASRTSKTRGHSPKRSSEHRKQGEKVTPARLDKKRDSRSNKEETRGSKDAYKSSKEECKTGREEWRGSKDKSTKEEYKSNREKNDRGKGDSVEYKSKKSWLENEEMLEQPAPCVSENLTEQSSLTQISKESELKHIPKLKSKESSSKLKSVESKVDDFPPDRKRKDSSDSRKLPLETKKRKEPMPEKKRGKSPKPSPEDKSIKKRVKQSSVHEDTLPKNKQYKAELTNQETKPKVVKKVDKSPPESRSRRRSRSREERGTDRKHSESNTKDRKRDHSSKKVKKAKRDKKKKKKRKRMRSRSSSTSSSSPDDEPVPKKSRITKEDGKERDKPKDKSEPEKNVVETKSSVASDGNDRLKAGGSKSASSMPLNSVEMAFPSAAGLRKFEESVETDAATKLNTMSRAELLAHAENAIQQKGMQPRSTVKFDVKKRPTNSVVVSSERQSRKVSMDDLPTRTIQHFNAVGPSPNSRRVMRDIDAKSTTLSITVGKQDCGRSVLSRLSHAKSPSTKTPLPSSLPTSPQSDVRFKLKKSWDKR